MRSQRLAMIFAAPIAVALAIACGGNSGTSSKPGNNAPAASAPNAATVAVGKPLDVTRDMLGTKTVVTVTVSEVKAGVKGDEFNKPQRGQFITAKVTVVDKEGKYLSSSANFKLVGPDGAVYDATGIGVAKPDLPTSELAAGQSSSGYVSFDTPAGAEKGGKIAVKDWLAEGDAGYWTLG